MGNKIISKRHQNVHFIFTSVNADGGEHETAKDGRQYFISDSFTKK